MENMVKMGEGRWMPVTALLGPHVKVKRVRPDAILPRYQTDGAAGLDLHACIATPVGLGVAIPSTIPTGIAIELPSGYEAQVRPRSSCSRDGIHVFLDTIDSDYRGEVHVLAWRVSGHARCVLPGDRIAQLVIAPVARATLVEVDELGETDRGSGGFGSTGR